MSQLFGTTERVAIICQENIGREFACPIVLAHVSQRHAGVTARTPNDEQIELGLRFDIVVDLASGYGDQGVLEVEVRLPCFLCLPYGVQAVATDAAG